MDTTIRITCQKPSNSLTQETHTQTLSGIGQITIQPSCTIVLPDNRRYFSNPILEAESLDQSNMLNILKESNTNAFNYSFKIPTTTPSPILPVFELKRNVNTTLLQQIMQEITEPAKSITVVTIFTIFILSIALILMCCCMFNPCFRTWFSTCTFLKNPKTWWTQYKQYNVHDFSKIAHSNLPFSKLRNKWQPKSKRHECPQQAYYTTVRQENSQSETESDIATNQVNEKPEKPVAVPRTTTLPIPTNSYISAEHQHLYPQVIFSDPTQYRPTTC